MSIQKNYNEVSINQVERAISELRRGFIVELEDSGYVTASPEAIDDKFLSLFLNKFKAEVFILLSANRASAYYKKPIKTPLLIKINSLTEVEDLAGFNANRESSHKKVALDNAHKAICSAALKLCRYAELIPALLLIKINKKVKIYTKKHQVLSVSKDSISRYEDQVSYAMNIVSETPLVLKNARKAKIIAFRPQNGNKEHYAIIIGKPEKEPEVRIHSSCYTGDLLGSLRCDCRDQLHETIDYLDKNKGGIILYLMQEGRGIGLVNKLRTYSLQYEGLDTVDANKFLGYEDDERPFLPAAIMLKQLGYSTVSLISNNPKKAAGLKKHGIKVKKMVPIIIKPHKYNQDYLATKSKRLGHKI